MANDSSDAGQLQAFNASNVLLATYTTAAIGAPGFETASIARGTADIAYIIAAGSSINGVSTVDLDHLVYDAVDVVSVPNPSALLLIGAGLAGLRAVRALRRR